MIGAVLIAAAVAGDAPPAYAFPAGEIRPYAWRFEQTVTQETAGDAMTHRTEIAWDLAIEGGGERDGQALATLTVLAVRASHVGPGISARIDTAQADAEADPLLGQHASLRLRPISLRLDPRTGAVAAAAGGERIAAAVLARLRERLRGDPSAALAERVRAAYADASIARQWGRILALPGADGRLALDGIASGEALRTWTGPAYRLAAAPGPAPTAVISDDPALPIAGRIEDIAGEGRIGALEGGWPGASAHALSFRLILDAAGQRVTQRHSLSWRFAPAALR